MPDRPHRASAAPPRRLGQQSALRSSPGWQRPTTRSIAMVLIWKRRYDARIPRSRNRRRAGRERRDWGGAQRHSRRAPLARPCPDVSLGPRLRGLGCRKGVHPASDRFRPGPPEEPTIASATQDACASATPASALPRTRSRGRPDAIIARRPKQSCRAVRDGGPARSLADTTSHRTTRVIPVRR
jgi:hypothetical protein